MEEKRHKVVLTSHPKWYILFLFPGIACIIAGAIFWGTADHQRQLLVDELNTAITSYDSNTQPLLAQSSFNLTIYANFSGENTEMSPTTDIPHFLEDLIEDKSIPSFEELYFSYTGQLFSTCPAPIPPFGNAPTGPVAISSVFNSSDSDSQINSGELPLYIYSTVSMSMKDCAQDCLNDGGYFDEKTWACTTFKVLSSVCLSVYFDGGWKLNSEAPGCVYPFDSMAIYTPWKYDMNSSLHFEGSVTVRAVSDPYIYYGNITLGTLDINSSVKNKTIMGRDLSVAGLPTLAVGSGIIATLLYIRNVKRKKLRKDISVEIKKHIVWPFAGVSFLSFIVVLCIGVPLISHWSQEPTFNAASFIGIIIIVLFTPVAWVSLLLFWSSVLKNNEFENARKFSTVLFSLAIMLVACVLVFTLMVKPWDTYGTASSQTDGLQQIIGIYILTFTLPFMGVTTALLFPIIKRKLVSTVNYDSGNDSKLGVANESSSLLDKVPIRQKKGANIPLIVFISFVFVFLPLIMLAVFLLPPIWNVPITTYRSFVSPNSVVQWMPWGTGPTDFTFKFYVDTLVFYGCLYGFILFGLLIKFVKPLGFIFHKRFRLPALPFEIIGKAPYAFVGEIVFCLSWLGICAWWFYYWYVENSRISALTDVTERLARTLGHMTNIAMASLLFPVARTSIWSVVFGIAFERAVQFHRWAGAIAFGSLTLHMIIWFANWWIHGSLLHNMFAIENIPHADNWTMPIMIWITWLGCLIMIVLALDRFRRKNFELFYYVHHFYIVIYFTGLIHAWSFWYPLAPSLFLYFVDRLVRYYRSSSSVVSLESMEYGYGKHTKLTLKVNESQSFVYEAGQYAWINIPAIDGLQWHPFSISSAPEDDLVTFHIKNMGKETWTGRLGSLAKSHSKKPFMTINSLNVLNTENIAVNIDGPYGNPMISPYNYDVVVLVCGGIGVTPMHSILMHLFNRYYNDDIPTLPQKVYFMWNVRESSTIAMFYDSFTKIDSRKSDGAFNLILNVTDKNSKLLELIDSEAIPYKIGRMDLRKEFTDVKMNSMAGSVGCFVCGPNAMVNEVSDLCFDFGFDFHTETFAL